MDNYKEGIKKYLVPLILYESCTFSYSKDSPKSDKSHPFSFT